MKGSFGSLKLVVPMVHHFIVDSLERQAIDGDHHHNCRIAVLHHVVGELLERSVDPVDLRRPLAQHGVTVETDGVPRHAGHGTGTFPGVRSQARTGSTSTRSRPGGRSPLAKRAATAGALWELSERLTDTKFPL